eukprot:g2081.t1
MEKVGDKHVVQDGETLIGIALQHGLRVSELKSYNKLFGSSLIFPGQVLCIRPQAAPQSPVARAVAAESSDAGNGGGSAGATASATAKTSRTSSWGVRRSSKSGGSGVAGRSSGGGWFDGFRRKVGSFLDDAGRGQAQTTRRGRNGAVLETGDGGGAGGAGGGHGKRMGSPGPGSGAGSGHDVEPGQAGTAGPTSAGIALGDSMYPAVARALGYRLAAARGGGGVPRRSQSDLEALLREQGIDELGIKEIVRHCNEDEGTTGGGGVGGAESGGASQPPGADTDAGARAHAQAGAAAGGAEPPRPELRRRQSFSMPRLLMAEGAGGRGFSSGDRAVEISSQILSPGLRGELERALPPHQQAHDWRLLYSSLMHGGSFSTFFRFCAGEGACLVAFETEGGDILGGFCTEEWRISASYFGTGEAFVWRDSEREGFTAYPWSGANNYVMHATERSIAMGGGGSFAWLVDSDFARASSAPCATFSNPMLAVSELLEVVTFEVWGFVPKGSVCIASVGGATDV